MQSRASVFVGSSSEGLPVAEGIQENLNQVADVSLWTQGVFELSQSFIESLIAELDKVDFAVLILAGDDLTLSRDVASASPRDNVLFELGLFMGRLGRDRCFFVHDATLRPKLPTDLLGVSAATYRSGHQGGLTAALGSACTAIKRRIGSVGIRPKLLRISARSMDADVSVPDVSGLWAGYSPDGPNPSQQNSTLEIEQFGSFIRATITRDVRDGMRVFEYEGRITAGQLVLVWEEQKGRGFIVGTMVLHILGDLRTMVGNSTYYHHTHNRVVSTPRTYRRLH